MKKKNRGAVALAVVLALCCGVAAACRSHTEHTFGRWQVRTAATCTEAGVRFRRCTGCDKEETEAIPAPGHLPGESVTVKEAATCRHGGVLERECSRCHEPLYENTDPIDHDWVTLKVLKAATCYEPGSEEQYCSMCETTRTVPIPKREHKLKVLKVNRTATCLEEGEEVVECLWEDCTYSDTIAVPKLEHQWVIEARTPATCTEAGSITYRCNRGCGTPRTDSVEPLGHSYLDYTIDRNPTFEAPGEKSYYCTRCGERDMSSVTSIPKLEKDVPITYEFRTLRTNGERLDDPGIVITVYDGESVAARSDRTTLSKGVFAVELLPKAYTVKVTNLPAGYRGGEEATVVAEDPYCNLVFTAAPIAERAPAGTQYRVGSVMHDFTDTTVDGKQVTLSGLLAAKKVVILNFFYVHCQYCDAEFPGFINAYSKYEAQAAVVALDPPTAHGDDAASIRDYALKMEMPASFSVTRDTAGLAACFGATSFPVTVVIDREGVVVEIHIGYTGQATYEDIFAKYTSDAYIK